MAAAISMFSASLALCRVTVHIDGCKQGMCSGPACAGRGERPCAASALLAAERPRQTHPAAAPRRTGAVQGPVGNKVPMNIIEVKANRHARNDCGVKS